MPLYGIEPDPRTNRPDERFEIQADSFEHAAKLGAQRLFPQYSNLRIEYTARRPTFPARSPYPGSRFFQAFDDHGTEVGRPFFVRRPPLPRQ
jgi:hypothetical protein